MERITLSRTAEHILVFLLHHLGKEYSIREIAISIGQDYKIVFTTMQHLKDIGLVHIRKVSNLNQCSVHLIKDNSSTYAFLSEHHGHHMTPHNILIAIKEIIQAVPNPYFTLLLFGSYAKGTARPRSDIDLLVILPDKREESTILSLIKRAATLNNLPLSPIILTAQEFQSGLKEPSVSQEAYHNHLIIYGGEAFHGLISS